MAQMPSKPFTMSLIPPMSDGNPEVLDTMKMYSATKYGRMRAEVDREINQRLGSSSGRSNDASDNSGPEFGGTGKPEAFLDRWMKKKEAIAVTTDDGDKSEATENPVFQNVVPDDDVEVLGGKKPEEMAMPDENTVKKLAEDPNKASEGQVFKIR